MMLAARFHGVGRPIRLEEVPVPEPAADEVRVRVGACGICGSDLHIVAGTTLTGTLPITLGHEGAGTVDALGADVTGLAVGDRVALAAGYGCGRCPACRAGRENICPHLVIPGISRDGAQARFVTVPARSAVRVPPDLDLAVAAVLTDAVATPLHAIRRAGVREGDTVAVFGVGGLGLPAVLVLTQLVGARVVAVDTRPAALERAALHGAVAVVDASEGRPARRVRALTDGGVDASFEFVGAAAVVDQAVKSLRPGGVATVVGVGPEPLHLGVRQETVVAGEMVLQGSFGSTLADLTDLVAAVTDGRLDLHPVVTHRFPLAEFATAMDTLRTGADDPVRVVVQPD